MRRHGGPGQTGANRGVGAEAGDTAGLHPAAAAVGEARRRQGARTERVELARAAGRRWPADRRSTWPRRRAQWWPTRFHPDTREWFAVVEGEVRVEIEGQAPFTATRGSLVNIPRQTHLLDRDHRRRHRACVSSSTSPRAKTRLRRATPSAAGAAARHAVGGGDDQPHAGRYDEFNKPHLNIHEEAARNEKYTGGRFVRDDKSEMLVLYGHEKNLPPLDPSDKGHFHAESAEFWLVFAGKIRYAFEGQEPFIASEGDVVYVPAGTWHATRYTGPDPSCRLSITEYVGNTLVLPRRTP